MLAVAINKPFRIIGFFQTINLKLKLV